MRLLTMIDEAARTVRAQRTTSMLVALLCASICVVTLLTVGGTAAAEAQVLGRLDAAGSRLLVVTDKANVGLVTPAVLGVIGELNTVERAVGADTPFDVTNGVVGVGGAPVPAWRLSGPMDQAVDLAVGRWPQPGEALVSTAAQRTLGLALPAGAVIDRDGRELPVVGAFAAKAPFDFLANGVVVAASTDSGSSVTAAYIVITSAAAARSAERAVIATLAPPDLNGITIESPAALADLQRVVSGDLGGYSRSLLLLTLAAGGFLLAIVVLAEVMLRRRDLGRRRALGAPRWGLVALVVARTGIAAAPGIVVGVTAGVLAAQQWAQVPPWDFTLGTACLTLITATLAAAPPALTAAWRDPVAVLRTP